jgi:hypothetical protein
MIRKGWSADYPQIETKLISVLKSPRERGGKRLPSNAGAGGVEKSVPVLAGMLGDEAVVQARLRRSGCRRRRRQRAAGLNKVQGGCGWGLSRRWGRNAMMSRFKLASMVNDPDPDVARRRWWRWEMGTEKSAGRW